MIVEFNSKKERDEMLKKVGKYMVDVIMEDLGMGGIISNSVLEGFEKYGIVDYEKLVEEEDMDLNDLMVMDVMINCGEVVKKRREMLIKRLKDEGVLNDEMERRLGLK